MVIFITLFSRPCAYAAARLTGSYRCLLHRDGVSFFSRAGTQLDIVEAFLVFVVMLGSWWG